MRIFLDADIPNILCCRMDDSVKCELVDPSGRGCERIADLFAGYISLNYF